MTATIAERAVRPIRNPGYFADFSHLLGRGHGVGPWDRCSVEEVMALLPELPDWPSEQERAGPENKTLRYYLSGASRGARRILNQLAAHPGEGWQARWLAAGADAGLAWLDTIAPTDPRVPRLVRQEHTSGLTNLLLRRVVLPSYDVVGCYHSYVLFRRVEATMRPDLFSHLRQAAETRGMSSKHTDEALLLVSKMVLHTGKDVDQLVVDDVLELFAWSRLYPGRRLAFGLHNTWQLLGDVGVIPAERPLRTVLCHGQRPVGDLIDDYQLECRSVRDVLARYISERQAGLDYTSVRSYVAILAGVFWRDLETHHPGIDSLHLPADVATAWKDRVRTVVTRDGQIRSRLDVMAVFTKVRAFYLDIQQWALHDPSWVTWAVPSPVTRRDTRGLGKQAHNQKARTHQRIRERLPHLPTIVDTAEKLHAEGNALLAVASSCEPGAVFNHCGRRYRRILRKTALLPIGARTHFDVEIEDVTTREIVNVTRREDEMFCGLGHH